jgi:hypothetical protein
MGSKFFTALLAMVAVIAFTTPAANARPMPNCIPGTSC